MVNQVAVFASSRWKARDQDGVRCRYNGLSEPCHRRHWCGDRDQGDVWYFDKPAKNDLHPTMKPVALVERAIRNSSKSRDIVLDPFGGSGTTLIAAERTGRRARLIELDPKYVDVAVKRWQQLTGGEARLADAGRPFRAAHVTASEIS
jgi:DNA modification methylase